MNCRDCGEPLQPGDSFCDNCGALVQAPAPAVAMLELTGETVSCPDCGTVNPQGARFCDQCGRSLTTESETEPELAEDGLPRKCPACGWTHIRRSDKFCGLCGGPLPVDQVIAVPQLLSAPEKMRLLTMAWDSCQDMVASDKLSDPFRMRMALLLEAIPDQGVSAVHSFLRELHQNDTELLPRVARLGAQYVAEHYKEPERDFAAAYLQREDNEDPGLLDTQVAFACVAVVRHLGHLLAEENRESDPGNPITQLLKAIRHAWSAD